MMFNKDFGQAANIAKMATGSVGDPALVFRYLT